MSAEGGGVDFTRVIDYRYLASHVAREGDIPLEQVGRVLGLRVRSLKSSLGAGGARRFATDRLGCSLDDIEDAQLRAYMEEFTWLRLAAADILGENGMGHDQRTEEAS